MITDTQLKALDLIFRARYNGTVGVARSGSHCARVFTHLDSMRFAHSDASSFASYLWSEMNNRVIIKEQGRWTIKIVATAERPFKKFCLIACYEGREIYNITAGYWYTHRDTPLFVNKWLASNWLDGVKAVIIKFNKAKYLGA